MMYLKDAHKQFYVVLFINSKGIVSDTFISASEKQIEEWKEKHSKTTGLFAIHRVGNLLELVPSRGKNP